jgi:hypothetical protein
MVGSIESDTSDAPSHSWVTEDYYYVMPWKHGRYDWALFRISWDDNWGRYGWTADVRVRGFKDALSAARYMCRKLFERWRIDLRARGSAAYRQFLEEM